MKDELKFPQFTAKIQRKAIKKLYIRITPPGEVHVSCPVHVSDREVRRLLEERQDWILEHLELVRKESRTPTPKSDTFQLWGRSYPIKLIDDGPFPYAYMENDCFVLRGSVLHLTEEERLDIFYEYYRRQLLTAVPPLMEKAVQATGLVPNEWRLRRMKTRWGSCNTKDRRIWLSLNLAKYPKECLYTVIIHELTHLLEHGHNERFYALMDGFYPQWRVADKLLRSK